MAKADTLSSSDDKPVDAVYVRCFAAGVMSTVLLVLFNGGLYTMHDGVFDWSRDISTWIDIAALLLLLFVARQKPALLRPVPMTVVFLVAGTVGLCLCYLGVTRSNPAAIVVGVVLQCPMDSWGMVLWLLACARLDARRVCLCLVGSSVVGLVIAHALSVAGNYTVDVAVALVTGVAMQLLCLPLVRPFFDRMAQAGPSLDRQIAQPRAFLPFSHTFYVFIFAFSAAFGFALRCEPTSDDLMVTCANLVAVLAVGVYAWRAKERPRVDTLFVASLLAVVIGFMLILPADARVDRMAAALLVAGYMCFQLLSWFALTAAAARNPVDAVPVLCWGTAVGYVGICAGVLLWMVPNLFLAPLLGGDHLLQTAIVVAITAGLVLFALATRRTFEFDATIEGIEPAAPAPQVEVRYVDALEASCDAVSERFGLTAREDDVMRLLAAGNKSSHIQQRLHIGANTVKYHVKNIYAKLGVHSQQELIDLVCG